MPLFYLLAHLWYENACCGDVHCRPVEDGTIVEKSEGVAVKGFGILSYGDPRLRWSQDSNDHLCIDTSSNNPKLICVYRRPKGV